MRLTGEQLARYERDGFLIFPERFSHDEVAILRREVERVAMVETDAVVREGEARAPKSLFRLHESDGPTASSPTALGGKRPRRWPRRYRAVRVAAGSVAGVWSFGYPARGAVTRGALVVGPVVMRAHPDRTETGTSQ